MKNISFCIPTHNNLEYLKLCVESIRENATYKDAPIIIYAEGCTDGTNEWLIKQEKIHENLIGYVYPDDNWHPDYWGIGGGMNFCAEKVETEFIFFLHSDMYIGPGADEALLVHLNNSHEPDKSVISAHRMEPDIWNVGVEEIIEYRPGTLLAPKDWLGHTYKDFAPTMFNEIASQFTKENNFTVRKGEGAGGFMISKKAWDFIGGNDPSFAPKSFEDMDLFVRMQLEGYHFVLTSKALIWHFGARSSHFPNDDFSKKDENQTSAEHKNMAIWYRKWGGHFAHDENGFIKVSSGYEQKYEELQKVGKDKNFLNCRDEKD